ncbi:CopG family transcriptional regulator [Candidatus Bipolaricaulota bacterium]|nr:CopG family transcriptional regulator [Candidatus Bipolaricaulota bacterium]
MANVKTAISLQQSLFEQVDALAQEMQISRSRLFALAVEAFIQHHQNQKLLEAINDAYADLPDAGERSLRHKMRQQHRQLVEGQW